MLSRFPDGNFQISSPQTFFRGSLTNIYWQKTCVAATLLCIHAKMHTEFHIKNFEASFVLFLYILKFLVSHTRYRLIFVMNEVFQRFWINSHPKYVLPCLTFIKSSSFGLYHVKENSTSCWHSSDAISRLTSIKEEIQKCFLAISLLYSRHRFLYLNIICIK